MSRLTTVLTCTLLLAWSAYPAGSVVAQQSGDSSPQIESATNTQTEAVDQLPQAQEPRSQRQQTRSTREADSRPSDQQLDRSLPDRQQNLRNEQPNRQLDRQFDRTRERIEQQGERPMPRQRSQQLQAQGQFEAEGRLETTDRAPQRNQAAMERQTQAQQQLNLGAEFSGSQESLTVTNVNEGTLAAEIGLRANDEIVSVGGRTVTSADELNQVLVRTPNLQQRIPIVVRRGGAPTTLYFSPQLVPEAVFIPTRRVDPGLGVVLVPRGNDALFVREVTGGLADVIGLRENDIIVSVAGRPVISQEQFADLLYSTDAEQIPIVIIRDGRRDVLFVRQDVLGFRMQDEPDLYLAEDAWLGVVLDAQFEDAAVVQRVVPGSPADEAGVRAGDWIVSVNGRRVTSANHLTWLIDSLEPGQQVELDVSRRISGTLIARLDGQDRYQPRQAMRPTYDVEVYEPGDVQVQQRQFYRGEFDADMDRGVIRDRLGPAERGLRDRLDRDEIPDEPRGLLPRR